MRRALHWLHVSDSHVVSSADDTRHLERLSATVDRVAALLADGVPIDFLVHAGDLVDDADAPDADPSTTLRALRELGRLTVPWYLLGGNHDRRAFLALGGSEASGSGRVMSAEYPGNDANVPDDRHGEEGRGPKDGGVADLELPSARHGELELLFLDANPEDGTNDVSGRIDARQVDAVEQRLLALPAGHRLALFVHYPPLAQEADWTSVPAGGEALHRVLRRHCPRLAGVFSGHVHRSIHHLRDGVLYVSAPAISQDFLLWPGQREHAVDTGSLVGFHYVTVDASGTRVQHHAFAP